MTFKVSESILMLKKANNLGKIGGSNESILMLKKTKNLGKIGGSHDFHSKWINFNAKKGKKFGQT